MFHTTTIGDHRNNENTYLDDIIGVTKIGLPRVLILIIEVIENGDEGATVILVRVCKIMFHRAFSSELTMARRLWTSSALGLRMTKSCFLKYAANPVGPK